MKTRTELDAAFDSLAEQLPSMIAENPDEADFWPAFAGVADEIIDNAGAPDCEYVSNRIETMLVAVGFLTVTAH